MFVRRRPLLRAAVVGGGAYAIGKHGARREAEMADRDERITQLEAQQASQAQPSQAEAASGSVTDQLGKLADLHARGALSDEEFAAAKARLLGS